MESIRSYLASIDSRLLNHVSGRPKAFIELFKAHHFGSEAAFAHRLLGDNYDEKIYSDWKSRTLRILQALAIISPGKGSSLVKKIYDNCHKKFLVGQKLLTQGHRKEGLRLVKQAYLLAVDYDFSHLACELASILHHDHSYYHPNKRMAEFYALKVKQYLQDYSAEKEAEYYFFRIIAQMHRSTVPEKDLREALEKISQGEAQSIKYKTYQACVKVYYHLYRAEYEQLITSCKEVLLFYRNKKGVFPAHYLFFLKHKGIAQIATTDYAKAAISLTKAERYSTNSPYNTYTLQYYKILNELHAGNYQTAYELHQKSKRCKIEEIRLHFAIIEAYLCFLAHSGYLQLPKTFRLGKYLNETLKAQRDKQGDNINILIAELLIYLVRDRGKFIDRVESIQDYSYRHLKGEETKRAKCFFKILCLMAHPKVNFHTVALQRKAGTYIKQLQQYPPRMGEHFAVEIMPYHHLLELIMNRVLRQVA